MTLVELIVIAEEKRKELNEKIERWQSKIGDVQKQIDGLKNKSINNSAEYIERERVKLYKKLEKIQKEFEVFKKEQQEKIDNWIDAQKQKITKANDDYVKQLSDSMLEYKKQYELKKAENKK